MILQHERLSQRMRLIFGWLVGGWTFDFDVVLDQDPILQHRHGARFQQLAVLIKAWRVEDHIVRLPFTRFARDVDERRVLAVKGSSLPVEVGLVLV